MAYEDALLAAPVLYQAGFSEAYQQTDTRVASFFKITNAGSALTQGIDAFTKKKDAFEVTSRFTNYNTPVVEEADRTWVTARKWHITSWIPEEDDKELDYIGSYESSVMSNHMSALHRVEDAELFLCAYGSARRGLEEKNTAAVPLPASQILAVDFNSVGGNTSITLSKLKRGLSLFHAAEVPNLTPRLFINAALNEDLQEADKQILKDEEKMVSNKIAYNKDYAGMIVVGPTGEVTSFGGVSVARTELLPETAVDSGIFRCLLADNKAITRHKPTPSGSLKVSFENKESAFFIKSILKTGCARTRDNGVVQILAEAGAPMVDDVNTSW